MNRFARFVRMHFACLVTPLLFSGCIYGVGLGKNDGGQHPSDASVISDTGNSHFCELVLCPAGTACNATTSACERYPTCGVNGIECANCVDAPVDPASCNGGFCPPTRPICIGTPDASVTDARIVPPDVCTRLNCPVGTVCDPTIGMCIPGDATDAGGDDGSSVPSDICARILCPVGTTCDPVHGICARVGTLDGGAPNDSGQTVFPYCAVAFCPHGTICDETLRACIVWDAPDAMVSPQDR